MSGYPGKCLPEYECVNLVFNNLNKKKIVNISKLKHNFVLISVLSSVGKAALSCHTA